MWKWAYLIANGWNGWNRRSRSRVKPTRSIIVNLLLYDLTLTSSLLGFFLPPFVSSST